MAVTRTVRRHLIEDEPIVLVNNDDVKMAFLPEEVELEQCTLGDPQYGQFKIRKYFTAYTGGDLFDHTPFFPRAIKDITVLSLRPRTNHGGCSNPQDGRSPLRRGVLTN